MKYLLQHLLDASAHSYSDATAVVDGERVASYRELDEASNRVARLLGDLGIGPGHRVGLLLGKSLEAVAGVYGVLKSGAAYVPLDPEAPPARLAWITRNCEMRCLLTGIERAQVWPRLARHGANVDRLVVLNGGSDAAADDLPPGVTVLGSDAVGEQESSSVPSTGIDQDVAYILYTSGSTGDPKGVMLTHLNALRFVEWAALEFSVASSDRLANHAPLHFDLSVFDLFAAAHAGACVALVPPRMSYFPIEVGRFIERVGVTVWYSVPSILTMMLLRGGLRPDMWPSLRTILFAGEVFPTKHLRSLMRLLPHVEFFNLFGPTETNACTFYKVPKLSDDFTDSIPIGRPIADVGVIVTTADGRVAERGEVGELWVRGSTVMRGYWGDPERTERALVSNPVAPRSGERVYRTGDLVREDEHGDLHFLGRVDNQIKSRGYRIELGEVEAALYAHPAVIECAVTAIPDEMVTNRIKAFVVVGEPVEAAALASFCAHRIPRYMIPEEFEVRPRLPKTSTGKVDRQTLIGGSASRST